MSRRAEKLQVQQDKPLAAKPSTESARRDDNTTSGGVTAADLKQAEVALRQATSNAEEERQRRNAAIRQALAEGWTHQQIADAMGISRGRVSQVAASRADGAARESAPD